MTLYAIYTKPEAGPDALWVLPQRFDWAAFILPPLWALARGAAGFLVLWAVVATALIAAMPVMGADAAIALYVVFALWAGFAAPQIAGRALLGRNWIAHHEVIAATANEAERIWLGRTYGAHP